MDRPALLRRLARRNEQRIVLLVLDGVGDLRTSGQPLSPLERARLPNLDRLARGSSLGRLVPVATGITPGSGPGHLALFGYDPTSPQADIGRGVLEALGLGLELGGGEIAVRGNFATADEEGRLTDRRAGRPSSAECRRLCARLQQALEKAGLSAGGGPSPAAEIELAVHPGEGHRFVLIVRGSDLSPHIADTDPQATGVAPLELRPTEPRAADTVRRLEPALRAMMAALASEPRANRILLRGFSSPPQLPSLAELYQLRAGAFAGYPLYRGVASACGMKVVECGKHLPEVVGAVRGDWDRFDFFFLHLKQTDQAGEDGNAEAKVAVLEEVDRALPELLDLGPDVLAITGDHSTPAVMRSHSWHPVPLLVASERAFVDEARRFTELEARGGAIGTIPAPELMGLLLAHAGKLGKYGA